VAGVGFDQPLPWHNLGEMNQKKGFAERIDRTSEPNDFEEPTQQYSGK